MVDLLLNIYIYGFIFTVGFCFGSKSTFKKSTYERFFPNGVDMWFSIIVFSVSWPLTIGKTIHNDYEDEIKNFFSIIKKQLSDFDKEVMKFRKK